MFNLELLPVNRVLRQAAAGFNHVPFADIGKGSHHHHLVAVRIIRNRQDRIAVFLVAELNPFDYPCNGRHLILVLVAAF